jgi:hypothetical protein
MSNIGHLQSCSDILVTAQNVLEYKLTVMHAVLRSTKNCKMFSMHKAAQNMVSQPKVYQQKDMPRQFVHSPQRRSCYG